MTTRLIRTTWTPNDFWYIVWNGIIAIVLFLFGINWLFCVSLLLAALLIDIEFLVLKLVNQLNQNNSTYLEDDIVTSPALFMSIEYILGLLAVNFYFQLPTWGIGLLIGVLLTIIIDITMMIINDQDDWRGPSQWSALYFMYFTQFSREYHSMYKKGSKKKDPATQDNFEKTHEYLTAVAGYNKLHWSFHRILLVAIATNFSLIGIGVSSGSILAYGGVIPVTALSIIHSILIRREKDHLLEIIKPLEKMIMINSSIPEEVHFVGFVNEVFWERGFRRFNLAIHITLVFSALASFVLILLSDETFIDILREVILAVFTIPFIFAFISKSTISTVIGSAFSILKTALRDVKYPRIEVNDKLPTSYSEFQTSFSLPADSGDMQAEFDAYLPLYAQYAAYNDLLLRLWDVHSQGPIMIQAGFVFIIVNALVSPFTGFLAPLFTLGVGVIIQMDYWVRVTLVRMYTEYTRAINKQAKQNLIYGVQRDKMPFTHADYMPAKYKEFRKWYDKTIVNPTGTAAMVYLVVFITVVLIYAFVENLTTLGIVETLLVTVIDVIVSVVVVIWIIQANRHAKEYEDSQVNMMSEYVKQNITPVNISQPLQLIFNSEDVYMQRRILNTIDFIRLELLFVVIVSIPSVLVTLLSFNPTQLSLIFLMLIPALGFINLMMMFYFVEYIWHSPIYTKYVERICHFEENNVPENQRTEVPTECLCFSTKGTVSYSLQRKILSRMPIFNRYYIETPQSEGRIRFCSEVKTVGDGAKQIEYTFVIVSFLALLIPVYILAFNSAVYLELGELLRWVTIIIGVTPVLLILYMIFGLQNDRRKKSASYHKWWIVLPTYTES